MTKSNEKKRLFIELLDPHKDTLYRVCKKLIINGNDIEDALQTTIISAYKSFDRFEEGSNFKAWIFKFLINTLFNFNKKYSRLSAFETYHEEVLDTAQTSCTEHKDVNLFEMLEKENIYHEILKNPLKLFENIDGPMKESLLRLKTAERTVFLLRSLTDLSYKEMSNVLEIPIGTVMSHLYRARAKLRESLCDYAREIGLFRDKDAF
ncbi:MAG: sigma-70 family RNA polymerase sigma factor [Candidatus Scalinduaceae bacterium]